MAKSSGRRRRIRFTRGAGRQLKPHLAIAPLAAIIAMIAVISVIDAENHTASATAPVGTTASSVNEYASPTTRMSPGDVGSDGAAAFVLLIATDGPRSRPQKVADVHGCGLNWRLETRANRSSGMSEVWTAESTRRVVRCDPVAELSVGPHVGLIGLYALADARIGLSAGASGTDSTASASLVASSGALVLGIGNDWATARDRSVPRGQEQLEELQTSTDDTFWIQSARVAEDRRVRLRTSGRADERWNFAAVEVEPSSRAGGGTGSATVSPTATPVPTPSRSRPVRPTPTPTATASVTPTTSPTGAPTATPTSAPRPTQAPRPTPPPAPPVVAPPPPPPPVAPPPPPPVAPPPPPTTGFPGAATTGVPAGVVLTASGGLRVTTPNTVIDSLDISGDVSIEAPGVVIKNSRIHGNGSGDGVAIRSGSVQILDSEIFGFENAIGHDNWSAYRVDIHSTTGDGVKLGSNVTLQDSWIHDLAPGPSAHADGGQMQGGVRNLVISHNTIDVSAARSANAALFLAPDLGPSTDGPVTVVSNYLAGGNYTFFCVDGSDGRYLVKGITIRDNVFGRSSEFGAARVNVPVTWTNNVWADSGAAVRY